MPAPDFFLEAITDSAFQVTQVFAGLTGDQWDFKVTPAAMSPREQLEHLAHVYHAFAEKVKSGAYDWKTPWSTGLTDPDALGAKVDELRSVCVELLKAGAADEKLADACGYILQHDSYHVGQMALVRMQLDPSWNPYSIYNH